MTDLYIANCTKQVHDFLYRIPENNKIFSRTIEPGSQIKITAALNVVESIIRQHERYAIIRASEVKNGAQFSGQIYQLDMPIDIEAIRRGIGARDTALGMQSQAAREVSAVALDDTLTRIGQQGGAKVTGVEVEIVEQPKGPADTSEKLHQRIEVQREGRPQPKPRGRRRAA